MSVKRPGKPRPLFKTRAHFYVPNLAASEPAHIRRSGGSKSKVIQESCNELQFKDGNVVT